MLKEIPDFDGYFADENRIWFYAEIKRWYFLHINKLLYSLFPLKYQETRGIKDLGSNFWNQGRTQEILDRVLHLSGD